MIRATTHLLAKSTSRLNPDAAPFQSLAASVVDEERVILLQTATVALYNPKCPESQMEGTVVFDSGSQQLYVSQAAVERLGLKRCGSKVLSIVTFGEEKGRRRQCYVVRIGIRRKHGLQPQELTLLSVPFICRVLPRISRSKLKTRHPQLARLDLADHNQFTVDPADPVLLIGLNHYWSFGETIKCIDGPVAGKPEDQASANLVTFVLQTSSDYGRKDEGRQLERRLKAFWDLESLGILDSDHDIYEQFHQIVNFREERYVVDSHGRNP